MGVENKVEMTEYIWRRKILAGEITNICVYEDGSALFNLAGDNTAKVTSMYMKKNLPSIGGYVIIYEDSYMAYLTKETVEQQCTKAIYSDPWETVKTKLSFGSAFEQIKGGGGMRIPSWSPDVIVRIQYPDDCSKMTSPYLYVESRFGKVPWKETMIELFSEKWEVVN